MSDTDRAQPQMRARVPCLCFELSDASRAQRIRIFELAQRPFSKDRVAQAIVLSCKRR